MTTLSPAWAVATWLASDGIADWRPTTIGGDTFLEAWNAAGPDAGLLIQTQGGEWEAGVPGFVTIVRIVVRGTKDSTQGATRDRATEVWASLLALSLTGPVSLTAGPNGAGLLVAGCWPEPPAVSRFDVAGRPETVLRVRVAHADLTSEEVAS